jgi:hypothetical protein
LLPYRSEDAENKPRKRRWGDAPPSADSSSASASVSAPAFTATPSLPVAVHPSIAAAAALSASYSAPAAASSTNSSASAASAPASASVSSSVSFGLADAIAKAKQAAAMSARIAASLSALSGSGVGVGVGLDAPTRASAGVKLEVKAEPLGTRADWAQQHVTATKILSFDFFLPIFVAVGVGKIYFKGFPLPDKTTFFTIVVISCGMCAWRIVIYVGVYVFVAWLCARRRRCRDSAPLDDGREVHAERRWEFGRRRRQCGQDGARQRVVIEGIHLGVSSRNYLF